jgi:hypothetical protein
MLILKEVTIMRFLIKFEMQGPKANAVVKERSFGEKMQQYLKEVNAENLYFVPVNGNRGGLIIVNISDQSEIVKFAEPLYSWFDAKLEIVPVMTLEDIQKGSRYIQDAADKYADRS